MPQITTKTHIKSVHKNNIQSRDGELGRDLPMHWALSLTPLLRAF